jgi:tRNA A-37 threonylcarbamoyl transferase component Bud32
MTTAVLAKGEILGGYRIDDIIGLGGMAIVYRAEQLSLGRPVALKVLAPQLSRDEAFRERFRREGKSVALLDHPHVLTVHDSGEIDGRLFLAMRLVDGGTLAERMLDEGLSADDTLAILGPIADALDAAHAAGLIHRDVKPQNILIGSNGHSYLADFGVATASTATLGLTGTGGFVGSVNYAAPEQIRGHKTTAACDIYALAAVLYQCLTGEVPYPRDTDVGIMHAHLHDPPPAFAVAAPGAAALNAVIGRGMAKDPRERYRGAGALMRAAAAALSTLSPEGRRITPTFAAAEPAIDAPLSDVHQAREAAPAPASAPASAPKAVPTGGPPAPSGGTEIVQRSERVAYRPPAGATTADRRRAARPIESTPEARGRSVAPALIAVAVTAAIVGLLFVVLRSGGPPVARQKTAGAGPLTLTFRSPWRATSGQSPASFALRSATTSQRATAIQLGNGVATLAAGELAQSAAVPGGAPPQLVARFGQPVEAATAAVAGHPGRRYAWKLASGEQLVAGIVPTLTGDLALFCTASGVAGEEACSALASHVHAAGVQFVPPAPDAALGAALGASIRSLAAARGRLAGLGAAALPPRALVAARVARQERSAVSPLVKRAVPFRNRGAVTELVAAVDGEAAAWSALGRAAAAADRHGYAVARNPVRAAGRRLATAVAVLGKQGFRIATLGLVAPPGLPPAPVVAPPPITATPSRKIISPPAPHVPAPSSAPSRHSPSPPPAPTGPTLVPAQPLH